MNVREDVVLAPYTTFGIGGPADYFISVDSVKEIIRAVEWANDRKLPFFILGTGANILVGDKGFRGVVIKNEANRINLINNDQKVTQQLVDKLIDEDKSMRSCLLFAESGVTIKELITFTTQKGLSGFEHFAGIPSSIGGALWQNMHFLSPDRNRTVFIGDIVDSATIFHNESDIWEKQIVNRDYFKFDYDYSILHDMKDIVLSVAFVLFPEDREVIQKRIKANLQWREEKHPENKDSTSAGSIFRKVEGYGAGRFIEQAGFKGKCVGGAKVSEQHANFIINYDHASANDVKDLILLIQIKVKELFGIELQPEINFVGEF